LDLLEVSWDLSFDYSYLRRLGNKVEDPTQAGLFSHNLAINQ